MNLLSYFFAKLLIGFVSIGTLLSGWFGGSLQFPLAPLPAETLQDGKVSAGESAPVATTSAAIPEVEIPRIKEPATTTPAPRPTPPPPQPAPAPQPTPTSNSPAPAPQPSPAPAPLPAPSADINVHTREALVNILCTTKSGGLFKPLSGSGVIIDPRGVIITNAHVAQFFLLRDYPVPGNIDCIIRVGSPAQARYRAELLYLPPSWMERNAHKIVQEVPTGTGEDDFALLRITGRTDQGAALPASFPYIEYRLDDTFAKGDPLLAAAYPAGFLGGATVQTNLFISSAPSDIKEVYTYGSGSIDLISVGGTVVSQQGSSGGAVVTLEDGKLAGVIVTSTLSENTADRDLRAITLYHINESMKKNTGFDLPFLLFGDLAFKASAFQLTTAPMLTRLLVTELER